MGVGSNRNTFRGGAERFLGILRSRNGELVRRFDCAGWEAAGELQLMGFEGLRVGRLDGLAANCPALKRIFDGDASSER